MNMPTPFEALTSIIEWTDCDNMPDDPKLRLEFYARRLLMIRNAARTVSMYTCIEFPEAIERNNLPR